MSRLCRALMLAGAGLGAAAALPASAALHPKYQRLAELRAVLQDAGVLNALGSNDLVDRVEFVRADLYRLHAGRCHVDAAIIGLPMPSGQVGGRRFQVRAGRRVCR